MREWLHSSLKCLPETKTLLHNVAFTIDSKSNALHCASYLSRSMPCKQLLFQLFRYGPKRWLNR